MDRQDLVMRLSDFMENETRHALWILEALPLFMFIACGMVVLPLKILRRQWLK